MLGFYVLFIYFVLDLKRFSSVRFASSVCKFPLHVLIFIWAKSTVVSQICTVVGHRFLQRAAKVLLSYTSNEGVKIRDKISV